ncbi:MAG: ABC transporter substrate-binding protein [Oscillospiraceae bacterium]|nr:ABC transporter substrate-binding protein [Oscillospiraceae bacterium]
MRRALCLVLALLVLLPFGGMANAEAEVTGRMALDYAENFSVDYYKGGTARLRIAEQDVLLLPEDAVVPAGLEALPRIPIPAKKLYLASSSAPDLFLRMDALDTVQYSSTTTENWRIPELRAAMEEERIWYAGKYSAPDYELLLSEGCGLVVENTMILHNPAVKEKLEELGFPVLIEYSSYEPHPLGRVEWIKLYGLLTGRLPEAEAFFDRQAETFRSAEQAAPSGKTVAFFHITPSGGVTVRRRADYITRMIELAGGETAITDLPEAENALSTETIQMESFYAQARDADVLIYNSTAVGAVPDMEAFLALNPLLADFRAVRTGEVWCTEKSMFQRSSAAADIIRELHAILCGEADDQLSCFYRVK